MPTPSIPSPRRCDDLLQDLPDAMHTTPQMSALFSGAARVRQMLRFEAALAAAQARVGVVPGPAAARIAELCGAADLDVTALAERAAVAGTIAVPVVAAVRAQLPEDVKGYLHLGATSQDVIDTAVVLQMRAGLDLLLSDLRAAGAACARLCREHRGTPMVGRTLLQQAVPVTFGLKAAGWLSGITRQISALERVRRDSLALQLGGAAGTLASLGPAGLEVAEALAEELDLPLPALPWHGDRSRIAEVASALATATGAMAKVALDVVLLMQSEVGEAAEAREAGKGQSSAMPQKANPVDTMAVLASARLVGGHAATVLTGMAQEHERSVAGWQAEWTAVPALFRLTGSAVARMRAVLATLTVDPVRMRANLERPDGQPMAESLATALAQHMGKHEAYGVVAALCARAVEDDRPLHEVALADERVADLLGREGIAAALDPARYLGSADRFVDRALESFEGAAANGTGAHPPPPPPPAGGDPEQT